jgi:cytoplasmic iron level regulating protein YaaA (DUF328/UPF0246 family)
MDSVFMITLLSPAKKLSTTDVPNIKKTTRPKFLEKTQELVGKMQAMSVTDLQHLLHISEALAELNYKRYQDFEFENSKSAANANANIAMNANPAVFLFHGDVYQSLTARSWDSATLNFSQDHLLILSGLYGLLRPLDAIQPYRLEMGTRLANSCGNNLYDFWQSVIAHELNERLMTHKNPVLVNLASNEYSLAVQPKYVKYPMVTIHFKEKRGDKLQIIGILAKKARGAMANFLMQNRIDSPDALKEFTGGGYRFCEKSSDSNNFNFIRDSSQLL